MSPLMLEQLSRLTQASPLARIPLRSRSHRAYLDVVTQLGSLHTQLSSEATWSLIQPTHGAWSWIDSMLGLELEGLLSKER